MSAYDVVIDSLRANGRNVKERASGAMAQCPAHDDSTESLSIKRRDDGKGVLVHCHAGCDFTAVLGAVGLCPRDLFDDNGLRAAYQPNRNYYYPDRRTVHRRQGPTGKSFKQSGHTKGTALYGQERIGDACLVYVVEGEKDVDAIRAVGGVAVCSAMGATNADKADWSPLAGLDVVIVRDRDSAGQKYVDAVSKLLAGVALSVRVVQAKEGKDAADHIAAGYALTEFVEVESVADAAAADSTLADTDKHSGQLRMAYRVAKRNADKLIHVYGLGWFVWDGSRFVHDERGAAKRAVLEELRRALAESLNDSELRADVRKCESASGVNGVLDLAAAVEPIAAAVADIDNDPHLLNVANGTFDLRALELRPHRPVERITKVCRGSYHPDAESAVWEAFLARVLPDEEVRGFVQRLIGLSLLGAVREHVLAILTGTGANGKGTFDRAIRYCLGDYAATAEPDLFMHRDGAHPTGEMDLRGLRLVSVSESDKDRRLAEATMKRLTGGDTIRARRMRQDFVEFAPSHTPLLITNHLPRVSGDDPAIWRRIRVVPFDVVIPEEQRDSALDARLEGEADAILTWAVDGWRDYLKRGLDEPPSVTRATATYQLNSDAVGRFIKERCTTAAAVKATTGQLFDSWEKWRLADGAEPMSQKAFGQALDTKGFPVTHQSNSKRWRGGIAVVAVTDESGQE